MPHWYNCHVNSSFHASFSPTSIGKHSETHPLESNIPKAVFGAVRLPKISHVGPVQKQLEVVDDESSKLPMLPGQCFYGQLTDKGRETLFKVGRRYRELYVEQLGFLPSVFSQKNIYLRSTDYPRTMESLQHLLGGFFIPNSKEIPIINTRFNSEENLHADGTCKKYYQLLKEFRKSYKASCSTQISSLKNRFSEYLKEQDSLHGIYDTFIAKMAHGYPLPPDISYKDMYDLEKHVFTNWFELASTDPLVARLSIGRALGEMCQKFEDVSKGNSSLKLAIYSGHDSTLGPILGGLKVADGRWPAFGSQISMEMFLDTKTKQQTNYYIRFLYNGKILTLPVCKEKGNHKEGNETFCTLNAFLGCVKSLVPVNYDAECELKNF
jgi:acid phosphatase